MSEANTGYPVSKNCSIKMIHGIGEHNYVASQGLVLTKYLNVLRKVHKRSICSKQDTQNYWFLGNANFFISC